ncbi:hypothetical protein EV702DRAFT_491792 [Suillus placidus]|uniref:Uncharacterized protein n=1 Tax=Suillus placidus TaxID=48579 RepID=A0A9P7A3Q7_9AGAM|nr:hypothetical protein EV702DRAFT_491792 [Suillus placidus]
MLQRQFPRTLVTWSAMTVTPRFCIAKYMYSLGKCKAIWLYFTKIFRGDLSFRSDQGCYYDLGSLWISSGAAFSLIQALSSLAVARNVNNIPRVSRI